MHCPNCLFPMLKDRFTWEPDPPAILYWCPQCHCLYEASWINKQAREEVAGQEELRPVFTHVPMLISRGTREPEST